MNYQEFKQAVINYAAANNIKDYELYYTKSDETSVEIFQTEVKGFNSSNSLGVCFRCIVNGQTGYASTENMTEEEAESIVLRAIEEPVKQICANAGVEGAVVVEKIKTSDCRLATLKCKGNTFTICKFKCFFY